MTEIHQNQLSLGAVFPYLPCPTQHCPPSTFLWLYPSRFMGKLQRLQVRMPLCNLMSLSSCLHSHS